MILLLLTMTHFKMIAEQNFKNLCNLTTSLVGLRKGALSYRSRKSEYQIPRSVVSVISRIVNETKREIIAKALKRDRSLIYHYEKMHESNYRSFPKYREIFNLVFNAYSNIQDSKRIFTDLYHLKQYLKDKGVESSNKHQTIIRITSGKVEADIKVSYKDLYNQLELCKLALQDCKYNLEII